MEMLGAFGASLSGGGGSMGAGGPIGTTTAAPGSADDKVGGVMDSGMTHPDTATPMVVGGATATGRSPEGELGNTPEDKARAKPRKLWIITTFPQTSATWCNNTNTLQATHSLARSLNRSLDRSFAAQSPLRHYH